MRIALISVHGCPVVRAGEKDAGGMNIYVLEMAKEFARRGICVDVYTRMHDLSDPEVVELEPGARVIHVASGPAATEKNDVYPHLDDFTEKVLSYGRYFGLEYDIVWSHYWLSGLVASKLARAMDVSHVTSFHTLTELKQAAIGPEPEHPERAASERQIMAQADRIVVWSTNERDSLETLYRVPSNKIAIVPPGVDAEKFSPGDRSESRRLLGLNGERLVLYVGRLERLKGVDILLSAMAMMERPDDACLMVVGGGACSPEREIYREHARMLGIEDRVTFHASMDQAMLIHYYRAADVCALPSYYESFGLAALEASACGTPVVASEVGGLPSIVQDGRTGFLVKWRAPGPFVDKLEAILGDDSMREMMGRAARQHATTLSWSRSADGLHTHFNELLKTDLPLTGGCATAAG